MLIIGVALLVILVVVFGRAVARFYVDMLWYDSLDQSGVFWGAIRARVLLFAMFFALFAVIAGSNLAIADKLAPSRFPPNAHPVVQRFHETYGRRLRIYRYIGAGVFAFLMALPTTAQWQTWLLFRNRQSFGIADEQFGADIGFYVFELPFLSFVLDWLFFALVLVLLLVLVTHVLNGGVMFASPIPTVNPGTRGHLAVLLAVLAALKAADYWIRRYETTNERRGFVQGATYSVVNALHPALLLLAFVALVTAGLFLSSLRTGSWRLPLIASAVWIVLAIVAGYIYPAVIQGLVVNPNQQARESEYISRNVSATRQAMGITTDHVSVQPVSFGRLSADDIAGDVQPLEDIRLLNPIEARSQFERDRGDVAGIIIADLDVDRYPDADGELQQVLVGARELDLSGLPNRGWQGRHLIYTRGCEVVIAPSSRVLQNGQPDYAPLEFERPELYFSPLLDSYAIARTDVAEVPCGENEPYAGTTGVEMSSFLRRAAFGLAFLDYNIVGSGSINDDSQMLWVRNIHDRLAKVAPFLSFDADPYPVAIDGRVLWVSDGYTSTSRYPYAEAVGGDIELNVGSGIPRDANYVRNSVKAVVDAYDGSVTLYVMDDGAVEPIVRAWQSAFPNLFTPGSEMPEGLRSHLRYPEDLFRIQSDSYSKYQERYEDDPAAFFERQGAWSVAQAPAITPQGANAVASPQANEPDDGAPDELAREESNDRFIPYYTMFSHNGTREFAMLRPFVPFSRDDSRTELEAYMIASSDPSTYGQLKVFTLEGERPDGPLSVATDAEREQRIGQAIAQRSDSSSVRFGDLQLVPIADGLLYVRPFYVAGQTVSSSGVPQYEFIIVSYAGRFAMARTIGEALGDLFPDLEIDVGERGDEDVPAEAAVTDEPGTTDPDLEPPPGSGEDDGEELLSPDLESTEELLAEADRLLVEADSLLRVGDLGGYQERVDLAGSYVEQALALVSGESAPSSEPGRDIDVADTVPTTSPEATTAGSG